ncbi:MAG: hypothetical protein H3C35_03570 [Bacteroidetes bacterium]|nr:hypothetical protein [Bacteroidota bacterium]
MKCANCGIVVTGEVKLCSVCSAQFTEQGITDADVIAKSKEFQERTLFLPIAQQIAAKMMQRPARDVQVR